MEQTKVRGVPKNKKVLNIIILALLLVLLGGMIASLISASKSVVEKTTERISQQYAQDLNAQMTSHLSSALHFYFDRLDGLYNSLLLMDDISVQKLEKYIGKVQASESISYLAFADENGMLYSAKGQMLGTMKLRMLGRLLNGENRIVSDNETIAGDSLILFGASYAEPILIGDKKINIALFGLSLEDLSGQITMNNDYSGGFSSIINKDGSFILKNPALPYGGLNMFEILLQNKGASEETVTAVKESVNAGRTHMITVYTSTKATTAYLYFAPVEGTEWYIVSNLPQAFIGESLVVLQDNISKISFIIICILLVVTATIIIIQTVSADRLRKGQIALEAALEAEEVASRSKTAFLFNMSHDIRTPMNAILGYTDIGLAHADQSEECFGKIKMAGGHLLNLINDILEMSRIESGKLELSEHEIDLNKLLENIEGMSNALAIPKSIEFRMDKENIRYPFIFADELHLNQVLINLISNAVKYTPEGGKVTFEVSQSNSSVGGKVFCRFVISDTGIGMSEEFQKQLFQPFSREATATVSKIEGAGLGLSIVKNLVELCGGTVHVHSVQHEGSTFTVDMPLRLMSESEIDAFIASQNQPIDPKEEATLTGMKVLLVEDNEINREIATLMLEDKGLVVEAAADGEIAVTLLKETGMDYYDFVLMDIQMPVMDGYAATKAIRAMPGGDKLKIIALSANAFEEDKKKSIAVGMNAHVAKPINITELMDTMAKLL